MLHLGLGSFHRAHQAVYLQRLIDAGDARWSLSGANIRPDMAEVVEALRAQGGRYTLETVSPAGEYRYEEIGAIREVLPWEPSLAAVIARGAAPSTRIVSFTVTEAGYYLDTHGKLDLSFAELAADIERARRGESGGSAGVTIYGALCAILRARSAAGAGAVTLLNCDNLRHNGDRFRAGLLEFIERVGDARLLAWVGANTRCPNAMVDRITPRPPPELRARVKAATGRDDAAAITGEHFIQWVIEDDFAAGRPDWGRVGVELVASVQPYEEAKIRILNASHSCIAWAGTLLGLSFIHEGTHHPAIRKMAFDYVTDDVIPCLSPSPIDLAAYRDVVLDRFGNPAIRDTNQRVAADGFSKIPGFIAPTVRERLAAGRPIDSVAVLPALFFAFLQRWHRGALPYAYQDQGMDEAAAHAICAAADPVRALCDDVALWGPVAGDARLVDAVRAASVRVQDLVKTGVQA
ncbi:D-arabinitol 4-dehydrogenase [Variovorax sp. TBS-050B]|uniref:D-arabinitol 4-dehydrogenase n=1 Tax=Variovorax sp. TBS-050B TaxID=2940551 RepID=UPI002476F6B0|nr:D-arabinitol 4-dehydrogenase [Variovorax sp. TBS-050B]